MPVVKRRGTLFVETSHALCGSEVFVDRWTSAGNEAAYLGQLQKIHFSRYGLYLKDKPKYSYQQNLHPPLKLIESLCGELWMLSQLS
jgi:hypothetical protein